MQNKRDRATQERIRVQQQGLGRPIISTRFGEDTFVAAGNTVLHSPNWKTFSDFLMDYMKDVLGGEWIKAEIAKSVGQRHPILQWHDRLRRYLAANQQEKGALFSAPMTGVVVCYVGLAYNLYLLKHNAELQSRLVARLKDVKQFQGAYYELLVANCLIRAGFSLELEDEGDQSVKHCEFSALSRGTGKRYWIEAKMRSVPELLGKSRHDGSTSKDPTTRLSRHLSEALQKPAPDQRMIFIDLNAEHSANHGPDWLAKAVRRLEDRERDLAKDQEAYVLVTNMPFHRALESPSLEREVFAHGLGISDFGKPGPIRLSDWYKEKQKHIDVHNVIDAFRTYPQLPDTFDGRPASEAFSEVRGSRLLVGQTYFFEEIGEGGEIDTVTTVSVPENEQFAYVGTKKGRILKSELTDAEYQDYKKYGDAYFGEPRQGNKRPKDVFDLYEWFVDCYYETPKERLLKFAKGHPDFDRLKTLDQFDLMLEVCESWASSFNAQGDTGDPHID